MQNLLSRYRQICPLFIKCKTFSLHKYDVSRSFLLTKPNVSFSTNVRKRKKIWTNVEEKDAESSSISTVDNNLIQDQQEINEYANKGSTPFLGTGNPQKTDHSTEMSNKNGAQSRDSYISGALNSYSKNGQRYQRNKEYGRQNYPDSLGIEESLQRISEENFLIQSEKADFSEIEEKLGELRVFIEKYSKLHSKTRFELKKRVEKAIESNLKRLIRLLPSIKEQENKNKQIVTLLFDLLFVCTWHYKMHLPESYNKVLKPFLKPDIIFDSKSADRFTQAITIMSFYDPKYSSGAIYQSLVNYLEKNFQEIMSETTKENFLFTVQVLSFEQLENKNLKDLLVSKTVTDINTFSESEIVSLFIFLSSIDAFADHPEGLSKLEGLILTFGPEHFSKSAILKTLKCQEEIEKTSKAVSAKILNILMQNADRLLDDFALQALFKNIEYVSFPAYFVDFLNRFFEVNYSRFSMPVLAGFLYQFKRIKLLEYKLFEIIEKHILENHHKHNWRLQELHHVFWTCIKAFHNDSPLFKTLEPYIVQNLKNRTSPEELSSLLWELSNANYVPDFQIFKLILKKSKEDFRNLCERGGTKAVSEILVSLSFILSKYSVYEEKNYQESYKEYIEKEFSILMPAVENWLKKLTFEEIDIKFQVKLFQFLFTIQFEFPQLLKNCEKSKSVIDYFKEKRYSLQRDASELTQEVITTLNSMSLDFQLEHRVYVYYVDVFIEPNLAIEIEGPPHYTKRATVSRHQDHLKEYHLRKLGFKIIKIPFFEFNVFSPVEVENKKKYLYDKIFGTK